jgi:Amt family ammonium transporter
VGIGGQLGVQAIGVLAAAVWSVLATLGIIGVTSLVCGLRASEEEMVDGLDFSAHGEKGYNP